ncbi:MAG: SoxR reducing system RseC family protein [Xanthomonadales bacterium]|nr:SoxR reducing system RseC family protein [Xanthomonadales bacterium]
MICQAGRVVRLDERAATVAVAPVSGCSRCAEGRGCGLGLFAGLLGERTREITVPARPGLQVGQSVRLEINPSALVAASLLAYGIPLLGLLLGLASGAWLGSELRGLAAGVFGAGVGFLFTRKLENPARIRISGGG